MTTEMFIKLVLSLASALGVIFTAYIVPLIKANISQKKLDQLSYYVAVAVRCAEQLYTPEEWKEKKQYVTDYVLDIVNSKLKINLDEKDIDIIIEGIVNEIKHDGDIKKIGDSEKVQD